MKPSGIAIKAFRQSKHIGSRELARRAGVSHQFMVRIQQGTRGASEQTMAAISAALDVPVEAISYDVPATASAK